MDLKCLPRLGFDPFSIDVGDILLEKRRIVQLVGHVSTSNAAFMVVFKAGQTAGMLWFGAIAYVLASILGRGEGW